MNIPCDMFRFRPLAATTLTSMLGSPGWLNILAPNFNVASRSRPRFVQSKASSLSPEVDIPTHTMDSRERKDLDREGGGSYKQALVDSWRGQHVGTINSLPSLTEPVSSSMGYDVIGSFNTRLSPPEKEVPPAERVTSVYIPGKPPRWDSPRLPFETPEEVKMLRGRRPLKFGHGDDVEKYLWKLPFAAIQATKSEFSFQNVDVMITAKRLEGFWKYCQGTRALEVAANATVINNTLFIDGFEPVGLETGSELDRLSLYAMCGSSWPCEYLDSFLHHRILCYKFGSLNIVVAGSVDSSIGNETAQVHVFESVLPQRPVMGWRGFHQTWFRRCPILVAARKEHGLINRVSISNISSDWKRWEAYDNNQLTLQRMVSVFEKIRDMLQRKAPGEPCIVKKGQMPARNPRGPPTNGDTGALVGRSPKKEQKAQGRPLQPLEVWQATHGRYPLPPGWAESFAPLPPSGGPLQ